MESIKIDNNGSRINISIDKNIIDSESLINLLKKLKYQELIKKAEFSDEIEDIADLIKTEWWKNNSKNYMQGTDINV